MENGDDWFAIDKLEHVLFCFFISIIASLLAARIPYSFIHRRRIWIGSLVSCSAGAAKEFADELGFFNSAGASAKDAAADFLGILLAALVLHLCSFDSSSTRTKLDTPSQNRVLEMV